LFTKGAPAGKLTCSIARWTECHPAQPWTGSKKPKAGLNFNKYEAEIIAQRCDQEVGEGRPGPISKAEQREDHGTERSRLPGQRPGGRSAQEITIYYNERGRNGREPTSSQTEKGVRSGGKEAGGEKWITRTPQGHPLNQIGLKCQNRQKSLCQFTTYRDVGIGDI